MTPKMDLKWSPKGALKLGGIVLFAIPKRSHKTALIFSPFWTPPDPKMDANGSQSDSKTSQVRPTSEAKKEDITTYNRQARLRRVLLKTPRDRQELAESSPRARRSENRRIKKWGGGTPPKGGFQLNDKVIPKLIQKHPNIIPTRSQRDTNMILK